VTAKGSSTTTSPARAITVERQVRAVPSASSRVAAPPPAPRSYAVARGGYFGGGSTGRGASSQMGTSAHSSVPASRGASGGGRAH
jgi:hypothetical protein